MRLLIYPPISINMQDLTNLTVPSHKKKLKKELKPEIKVLDCGKCKGFEEIAKILSKAISVVYEENILLSEREKELLILMKSINSEG